MNHLQWGNRKRLRCAKSKSKNSSAALNNSSSVGGEEKLNSVVVKKSITSRVVNNSSKDAQQNAPLPPVPSPHRLNRDIGTNRLSATENHRKASMSSSPEKEDRYYTTRGSVGLDDSSKMLFVDAKEDNKKFVWPKLLIALSSKEKEEDFMAMKGCKLPQRPKKRAKLIQKTLLLVSPGAWLSDLCQDRYEVREKKTSKKKPRGLKAMGSMESDSE